MENLECLVTNAANKLYLLFSSFFGSSFSIAFVSSLAGAFGGAIAAQKIIERKSRQNIFLEELRNVNSAIMVSFSICNTMLSLKESHTLPLSESFKKSLHEIEIFNEKKVLGELKDDSTFSHEVDFTVHATPEVPIDVLKELVFNKISAGGRVLSAVAELNASNEGVRNSMQNRRELIEKFKCFDKEDIANPYFGLTMPNGNTDQEYSDTIKLMYSYVDDSIFFSHLICNELMKYGNDLRTKYKKFSKNAPKVNDASFRVPLESKLIPPDSDYDLWLRGYKEL